jgi:hypothetical protein
LRSVEVFPLAIASSGFVLYVSRVLAALFSFGRRRAGTLRRSRRKPRPPSDAFVVMAPSLFAPATGIGMFALLPVFEGRTIRMSDNANALL